ncbi:MAG: hypothetical protein EZS28_044904, partial [Streblomastix strix]
MSDSWALGTIVLEMLLGKHPFEGNTQMDTIESIKLRNFIQFQISLCNILSGVAKSISDVVVHPYYQDMTCCGGIKKLFNIFSLNLDSFSKNHAQLVICQLYRQKEIEDPVMRRVIISHLKTHVYDSDKFTR